MESLLYISPALLESKQIVGWGYTEELRPRTYQEYLDWVTNSYHEPLNYLADHRKDKRASLTEVYPECESALVFLFDYRSAKKYQKINPSENTIAAFTIGYEDQDYHFWIKDKLIELGEELKKDNPHLAYALSLDVHPVLERDLAVRAGLGWFGKNAMLINRKTGSYQLIGSLLLNQKLDLPKAPIETDHCGTCTRCIDACPTNAIIPGTRSVEANKCISTYTIELFKDAPAPQGYPTQTNEVFGCDICQQVCPWNDKPLKHIEPQTSSKLLDFFNRELKYIIKDIEEMSNKNFKDHFKQTSFERVGKRGLLKNLKCYLKA